VNRALTPTGGARLLLERAGEAGAGEYRAAIYTPGATYEGHAALREDGSADVDIAGAPAELADALRMLAKLTARAAPSRRAEGLPVWPARVLRWRGPGRGG
jgi:hypothetical protein